MMLTRKDEFKFMEELWNLMKEYRPDAMEQNDWDALLSKCENLYKKFDGEHHPLVSQFVMGFLRAMDEVEKSLQITAAA